MTIAELLDQAIALGKAAEEIKNPPIVIVRVPSGGNLQLALDNGGNIELEAGGTYESNGFRVRQSGTTIIGNGATLVASSGPALYVLPGVNDVTVSDLSGRSPNGAVFLLGANDAAIQATLDLVPRRITFTRVRVPTHRNKRGFEINAADVQLIDCEVLDTWATSLADSQGVGILNTPGNVIVRGGRYQAASENVLVGGDTMKIPGVIPTNLTFENLMLDKPLSWKTDGVRRAVKNNFELKTGINVSVRNCTLDGCWRDGQDGYAFMITPKSGGTVQNVLIENCRIRNVSSAFNFTGHTLATDPTPGGRTIGVVVRNVTAVCNKTIYSGRGIFCILTMGVGDVTFDNIVSVMDGTSVILGGDHERIASITVTNSFFVAGTYGVMLGGNANATLWNATVDALDVRTNTIADANATLKRNLPENTYVTRAEFDPLVAERLSN